MVSDIKYTLLEVYVAQISHTNVQIADFEIFKLLIRFSDVDTINRLNLPIFITIDRGCIKIPLHSGYRGYHSLVCESSLIFLKFDKSTVEC